MSLRTLLLALSLLATLILPASAQTPVPTWSCMSRATPETSFNAHRGHNMHAETLSFDQLYIDMMVPHHEAVIALAEAALPELTEPVLVEMAENIIANQSAENKQLLTWRLEWFGSAETLMDEMTMPHMLEMMPIGSMDEMMLQMDPVAQVTAFCAADDPDQAFARQVLVHHQMAVNASVIAVEQAEQPDLVAFAKQVIIDQQAEIDVLLAYLGGAATPSA